MNNDFKDRIAKVGTIIKNENDFLALIKEFPGEGYFVPATALNETTNKKYKITIDEFWNSRNKFAIHTPTLAQSKLLCKIFDKMGKKWKPGTSYTEAQQVWFYNFEKTCYTNNNTYDNNSNLIEYGYLIYKFEEVDLEKYLTEEEKESLSNLSTPTSLVETILDDSFVKTSVYYNPEIINQLKDADINQVEKVREFLRENFGYETLSDYDKIWINGDKKRAKFIQKLDGRAPITIETILDGSCENSKVSKQFKARFNLIQSLTSASEEQVAKVREFILNKLGAESLATYDALWVNGNAERKQIIDNLNNTDETEQDI